MTMKAKYPGTCRTCGGAIRPGDTIDWEARTRQAFHLQCPPVTPRPAAPTQEAVPAAKAPAAIELSGGSGYGCKGWQVGQIVQAHPKRVAAGGPEWLYVLRAGRQYHSEEGMSFGVGDDRGYTYWAKCRAATAEEAAPAIAAAARGAARKVHQARVVAIKEQIQAQGERPAGAHRPEGDRQMDTQNIYGGGDWFVVGPEWVWYVRNNGADGDNWAVNNVGTGGAGAIGWRVPATPELVAELRQLAEALR